MTNETPKNTVTDAHAAHHDPAKSLGGADTVYFMDPNSESPAARGVGSHTHRLLAPASSHLVTKRDANGYGYFE